MKHLLSLALALAALIPSIPAHAFSIPCRSLNTLSGEHFEPLNFNLILFGGTETFCRVKKGHYVALQLGGIGPGLRQGVGARIGLHCPFMSKRKLLELMELTNIDRPILSTFGVNAAAGLGIEGQLGVGFGKAGVCFFTGLGLGAGAAVTGGNFALEHPYYGQSQRQYVGGLLDRLFDFPLERE